jgi:hypothetical protein
MIRTLRWLLAVHVITAAKILDWQSRLHSQKEATDQMFVEDFDNTDLQQFTVNKLTDFTQILSGVPPLRGTRKPEIIRALGQRFVERRRERAVMLKPLIDEVTANNTTLKSERGTGRLPVVQEATVSALNPSFLFETGSPLGPISVCGGHVALPGFYTVQVLNWTGAGMHSETRAIGSLQGHQRPLTCTKFLPGHPNTVVTASNDSSIRVWDTAGTLLIPADVLAFV